MDDETLKALMYSIVFWPFVYITLVVVVIGTANIVDSIKYRKNKSWIEQVDATSDKIIEVIELSDEDIRDAIDNAISSSGFTLEELQEQGKTDKFKTEEARLSWFVVSSLIDRIDY